MDKLIVGAIIAVVVVALGVFFGEWIWNFVVTRLGEL